MNYNRLRSIPRLQRGAALIARQAALLVVLLVSAPQIVSLASAASAASPKSAALAQAALQRTKAEVTYDGAYRAIDYPGGDVPANTGVCSDVVIRSFRAIDVDLQVLVHEDMQSNFSAYPDRWGLKKPDANIDHRRVPNLEVFFQRAASDQRVNRKGAISTHSFAVTQPAQQQFEPGDVVSWRLNNGLPHIGIVAAQTIPNTNRHYVVHNIGRGPVVEDVLLRWRMIGHFRYLGTAHPETGAFTGTFSGAGR